MDLRGLK